IMPLDTYFYKVRRRYPRLARNLWQILSEAECFSPTSAITLVKIRDAYWKLTEEKFPCMGDPRVEMLFLLSIPFVACFSNEMGTLRFYIVQQKEG
ncbi:hypothetical protein KR222_009977, partial [Zaprionus bogoriensis]